MNDTVIEVKNLTKKFGSFTAVNDISFSVKEGEIIGLLGPNGAGKTTTINMLLGLILPSSGSIELLGKDLQTSREEILSQSNFSSSYTHMPFKLTVWENLYVVGLLYSVKNLKAKVNDVLQMMKLTQVKNKLIEDLSSGWTIRVNLARTFLNDPKIIILDEPTASLDPEAAQSIRSLILEMKSKFSSTILWTSHNMAEVEEMCDRVIFLNNGKIIAEDTPWALAKRIGFCRVRLLIIKDQNKVMEYCLKENYKTDSQGRYITIQLQENKITYFLTHLANLDIHYEEISIDKPTLEDFFISMS